MSQSLAQAARRGLLAGTCGGTLMSISTNVEMRIRNRPPSRVPAQAAERLTGLELGRSAEERLVSAGHVLTSAVLGMVRGLLSRAGLPKAGANALFAGVAFLPDFVLMPALGDVEAPWRWSPVEIATSAAHHAVYAGGTIAAWTVLERTAGAA